MEGGGIEDTVVKARDTPCGKKRNYALVYGGHIWGETEICRAGEA